MNLDLIGKKALVTGGSRGIGHAIVLALAQQGVSVAAGYQQESKAVQNLALELESLRNNSYVFQADVSDEKAVKNLVDSAHQRFGTLDILVNNAGIVSHKPLSMMEFTEWQHILNTNLSSMYLVTRAALELMTEGGSIINIASAVAAVGMPGRTHYTASKAGVVGFTRSLCKEVGQRAIRANVIAPGIIETDQAANLTPEQRVRYANLAALGRLGQPEDIASAVLFLASDLSRFVSGVTFVVDGGI